ncbi:MAG: hypothetical protein NC191_04665 [Muribaculaceae bacterium]|nr:hypothetical protein [Muribaculaceae bacterium]
MIKISSIGKYLDQPLLTANINRSIPAILGAGSALVIGNQIKNAPKDKKAKAGIKSAIILGATVFSAIKAPKIAAFITKKANSKTLKQIREDNTGIISEYLSKNVVEKNIEKLLLKAKTKILTLKEIDTLNRHGDKELVNKLIPPPANIQAKDIFKEIGWLSIYGAVPVAGGISGGVIADRITEKNWKDRIPNKVNEGIYQYLANIFLCNIGAGAALGILEKLNIKSKAARCIGMVTGILATGVIGGSFMANYIGNKVINPLVSKKYKPDYRTPELLDLSLHTDDIATVSLLSGLKWIEPSLPILYSISGYRAGIGYRNHDKYNQKHENKAHFLRTEC